MVADAAPPSTARDPITLTFYDRPLEQAFAAYSLPRGIQQARVAIAVGVVVYLLLGLLDLWLVPPAARDTVWTIRLTALGVPLVVYAVTFRPVFERAGHLLLALVPVAAGVGLLAVFSHLEPASLAYYYPALILLTFYTYNLIGLRFIYALIVGVGLLVAYNVVIGGMGTYPLSVLATHDFLIVSANLIGGAAGYLREHQDRLLFLREQELDEQRRRHLAQALHDPLTGLPNRELLNDRMTQALNHANRDGSHHAGVFIDLDGFKRINDQGGHEAGDVVLKAVAARLDSVMRETDTVSRLGGDEFFVLAWGAGSAEAATAQATKLLQTIRTTHTGVPDGLALSASIGICLFPYEGATVADIVRRADQAMYAAKKAGKDRYLVA